MKRLRLVVGLSLLVSGGAVASAAASRPNVLVIVSDDQKRETIHALGNPVIQTPNIDRLVARGMTFTHVFCMGSTVDAVCAPSRAMLMTGRSLYHTPIAIPPALPTWPETMRQAGYLTYGTGKWHNGVAAYVRSFSQGGPIFFGSMADHLRVPVHDFMASGRYSMAGVHAGAKFSSELWADAAVKFLKDQRGKEPFFAYIAFTAPHDPRIPPGKYATLYDPERMPLPRSFMPQHPFDNGDLTVRDELLAPWPRPPALLRKHIAAYYGMITHLDTQIGRVLDALEASGQASNTIILFTSDHGLALGGHGLMGKQNLYDESMRPPLLISGPGIPRGKSSDALCYLFDLYPTVCDLTGVAIPRTVEGKSLAPIIQGKAARTRDSLFGAYLDVQRMVRTERWKLIWYPKIDRYQLFDIEHDPDELHDLSSAAGYGERLHEMRALLQNSRKRFDDPYELRPAAPSTRRPRS